MAGCSSIQSSTSAPGSAAASARFPWRQVGLVPGKAQHDLLPSPRDLEEVPEKGLAHQHPGFVGPGADRLQHAAHAHQLIGHASVGGLREQDQFVPRPGVQLLGQAPAQHHPVGVRGVQPGPFQDAGVQLGNPGFPDQVQAPQLHARGSLPLGRQAIADEAGRPVKAAGVHGRRVRLQDTVEIGVRAPAGRVGLHVAALVVHDVADHGAEDAVHEAGEEDDKGARHGHGAHRHQQARPLAFHVAEGQARGVHRPRRCRRAREKVSSVTPASSWRVS